MLLLKMEKNPDFREMLDSSTTSFLCTRTSWTALSRFDRKPFKSFFLFLDTTFDYLFVNVYVYLFLFFAVTLQNCTKSFRIKSALAVARLARTCDRRVRSHSAVLINEA